MRQKAVFFDIDGTLVDSNEFHILAWDEAFRAHGLTIARDVLRNQIGKGADVLIPDLFPDIEESLEKAVTDAHSDIFKSRFLNLVRPFPSAADLVRDLCQRNAKVLLVSSSDDKEVEHYARLLDIENKLSGTVSFDDVSQTKPAGDLFAAALEKAGVEPHEALAIGDTPYDAKAAAKCEVPAILLRTGGFSAECLNLVPTLAVYTNIAALYSDRQNAFRVQSMSSL